MKARIELDEHFAFSLALQCPSCGIWEHTAIHAIYSGKEFSCDCGEDIRINPASLTPIQQEIDSIRGLIARDIELPV